MAVEANPKHNLWWVAGWGVCWGWFGLWGGCGSALFFGLSVYTGMWMNPVVCLGNIQEVGLLLSFI